MRLHTRINGVCTKITGSWTGRVFVFRRFSWGVVMESYHYATLLNVRIKSVATVRPVATRLGRTNQNPTVN